MLRKIKTLIFGEVRGEVEKQNSKPCDKFELWFIENQFYLEDGRYWSEKYPSFFGFSHDELLTKYINQLKTKQL